MTRLAWAAAGERTFETGLDRGVLYQKSPSSFSASSHTVTTGSKVFNFTYQGTANPAPRPGSFRVGAIMKITDQTTPSRYLTGTITAMTQTSVTVNVTATAGTAATVVTWNLERLDLAVAWNGLVAVDENGSDQAASYYVDGRPFLFLPKPKEFSASLKAYTYPDEFAQIQGVTEATDGMYLDSQQPESFDLCYRTLVGNDLEGTAAGYKIHLVYNCTVVPQGINYQSLSNQIMPIEFSWNIQAVPVIVEGYRPTAHIIIDTRHMDEDKLSALEDIIYGTVSTHAMMPDPQVIFDTLTYGDAIIITDLGNGEWEAQGSYQNVYMIGDGIFQIDNVNTTDHGDGTYTVSSTP